MKPGAAVPDPLGDTLLLVATIGGEQTMASVPATVLAVLAVLLIAAALGAMAIGDLMLAGFSFMSASLVIYFRETRFTGG